MTAPLLALVVSMLDVQGEGRCPDPSAVRTQLQALAPSAMQSAADVVAILHPVERGVRIEFRDGQGQTLGTRSLTDEGTDCDGLASATAVVLAAWAREQKLQAAAPPNPPPSTHREEPRREVRQPARHEPAPAPGPTPPESPKPSPPATLPPDLPAPEPSESKVELPPASPPKAEWDISAGLTASATRQSLAFGALLGGSLTGYERRLGVALSFGALGARSFHSTEATWERFALLLGPQLRFRPDESWNVDLEADVVGALLDRLGDVAGISGVTPDLGGAVGVRLLGRGGLWAGARGIAWPMVHRLPSGEPVPTVELLLALGLAWVGP